MVAYICQHVPFEGPAAIATWLDDRGIRQRVLQVHAGEPLPTLDDEDWLVLMGGPMSVNDEQIHPWLVAEKRCVAQAMRVGARVLGVCLGAQLITAACGAAVVPGTREIGWFPVHRVAGAPAHPLAAAWPEVCRPLHWHGEACTLPVGAVHIASSEACAVQAYALGERTLALQCHLEATPDAVRALIRHGEEDLRPGDRVQDAAEILADDGRCAAAQRILDTMLDRLAAA